MVSTQDFESCGLGSIPSSSIDYYKYLNIIKAFIKFIDCLIFCVCVFFFF